MFVPLLLFCRYAKSERLRGLVNLVVVGGVIDPEDTGDREESAECEKMHNLIKEYKLQVGTMGGGVVICTLELLCTLYWSSSVDLWENAPTHAARTLRSTWPGT